jgi:recombination protein RecA
MKKSTHVEVNGTTDVKRDSLIESIASQLNKANKDGSKSVYFLDEQDDPSTISDWVSTGSTLLDLAISNKPHGGLPVGRLVELNGLEGTGKSLMAAHVLSNTQKKGGVAVMIDTETSAAPDFWKAVGIDLKNLLYIPASNVEEVFQYMESIIGSVRKGNNDRLVTFVVDSVAGASTKTELESDHGKTGYATDKSIIISKAMRKITNLIGQQRILAVFTNQLRMNLKAMAFGDPYIVSGGKAMAYHMSVRVRMSSTGKLKKGDEIIGNKCKALVAKNRLGPPFKKAEFNIHFDSGIQDLVSWYDVCKRNDLFEKSMSTKTFVDKVNADPAWKEELYLKLCDALIMKYRDANSKIEEGVEETESDENIDQSESVSEE